MPSNPQILRYEVSDNVAEILFDSPPVNGLTHELMDALMAALARARADVQVRCVIIASALPGRFCGGLDLGTFLGSTPSEKHAMVHKLYAQLNDVQFDLGKPCIAAITGAARGGGMSLAIACDMMVASETSTFGYPELDIGLVPAIHYATLPRIIGRYRAFDLLFTGRVFSAQEAMSLGLVSRLAPESQVMDEARKLAQVLAAKSPQLMALGKRSFTRAIDGDYRQALEAAVNLVSTVTGMEDSVEGLKAFVEKRKPVWKAPWTAIALASLFVLAGGLLPLTSLAQSDYPSRPITIIVPYGPGSSTDNTARPIAQALTKSLGQSVIIDNKAGANGVIGTQLGARAKPDGYTLLVGSSTTLAANAGLFKNLPYDTQKDFQAISGLGSTSMMFMVRSDFAAKDLKSFLAYAARQGAPVPVAYGSSSAQVALALLTKVSGVKFTGVPYKGTPQAITDLLGGQVPVAIVDVGNGVPHLKSGKAVALAVSAAARSTAAPDVPTLAETWPGTQLVTWIALVAPAGTPMPIVEKLNNAITAALATPEVRQQFAQVVTEVEPVSHQDLTRRMQRDRGLWLELIKEAGIQPE